MREIWNIIADSSAWANLQRVVLLLDDIRSLRLIINWVWRSDALMAVNSKIQGEIAVITIFKRFYHTNFIFRLFFLWNFQWKPVENMMSFNKTQRSSTTMKNFRNRTSENSFLNSAWRIESVFKTFRCSNLWMTQETKGRRERNPLHC